MTDPLARALLELLAAGPATPTQLMQTLADAGAPVHFEAITAALRRLAGSGFAVRVSDGTWRRAESVTRPQDTQETTVTKIECQRCGETKAADEMLLRNGQPSKTCKACFAKAHTKGDAKPAKAPKPAKTAAKSAPAEKREPSRTVTIARLLTIKLRDANETEHVLVLTDDQAQDLKAALA